MQAHAEHRGRASVAIVGGVYDELIVQRDLRGEPGKAVIGLEDSFIARVWELPVADQDPKPASIEKSLVNVGDAVDDAGDAKRIVITSPLLSGDRDTGRDGPVDVGEFIWLLVTFRPSCAGEAADILQELLFEIQADAAAALIVSHRRNIGCQFMTKTSPSARELDSVGRRSL